MFIKKKHLLVIVISSLIISVVLISTLIGCSFYVRWKKDSFAAKYRDSIYKLTADIFKNDVSVFNINAMLEDGDTVSGVPVVVGSLKNNSNKILMSLRIKVSFIKSDGSVVYNDWFCPLGEQYYVIPAVFAGQKRTRNILLPGEGLTFRHMLRNCSRELLAQFSAKANFAKYDAEKKVTMKYSITGLSVQ